MPHSRKAKAYIGFAFFIGIVCDFVFAGVVGVVWFAVYGPCYLAGAASVYNYLERTGKESIAKFSAFAFLVGALGFHFSMTNWRYQLNYEMRISSLAPIVLESEEFHKYLFVSSAKLSEKLISEPSTKSISIVAQVVANYRCVQSFKILSIAGVNIVDDKLSSWTIKSHRNTPKSFDEMEEENKGALVSKTWPKCKSIDEPQL